MTVNPTGIGHDAVADFALLVAEATGVLTSIAEQSPAQRPAELMELRCITAEGVRSVCSIPAATSAEAIGVLPELLRTMLADVVDLGETITDGNSRTPLRQVRAVEVMTRSLSAALDSFDDPAFVARKAQIISTCADTLGVAPARRNPKDPVEALLEAARRAAAGLHAVSTNEASAVISQRAVV